MYYPLSQVKTNLYTNGDEFSLVLNDSSTLYTGYYWTNSKNISYTGKTPQDVPTQRLYPITPQISRNSFNASNPNQQYLLLNLPTIFYPDDISGAQKYLFGENIYNNNLTYSTIEKLDLNQKILSPYYSPTIPTEKDYQIGEFKRYFCKKTNEILYLEINKDTYDKLVKKDSTILWQLYFPFTMETNWN